jgi:hypothetical protein
MFIYTSGDYFTAVIESLDSPFLVSAHQKAVAFDISAQNSAHFAISPFICHMAPPFKGFKTNELRVWTIRRAQKPSEKSHVILEMENRFRSVGIGESEID